jgi:2-oxoglutarate ferredoxin oxidoreductase subunit alpha
MREFTDGSSAIVRGALAAGCTFFAGYPITPASPILMAMMRELPKVGGVAIQAEDEISSIGMCIGAAMSGAHALTATSGPGISLYSENIGLAIMGEVPLVIVDVQRLGPATGGATSVGQGDVQFVRWGTGGGYPIIALAPSSIPECYSLTMKAFDLAERFRCPVFLLTDKELNMTMNTVDLDKYQEVPVRERKIYGADNGDGVEVFAPYRYDAPGDVPPMAHFGQDVILRFTGSTHDERAFITKHPPKVDALNRHLAAKIEEHRDEIELVTMDVEHGARTLLISYGVTARAMREAVRRTRHKRQKVSALTIHSLWPVPEAKIEAALVDVEQVVVAELNLGQYRREIERIAPGREVVGLNRVDGELISPDQFLEVIG